MLAVSSVLAIQAGLAPTVPGASDNGTGLAGLLAVARRLVGAPLTETDVILLVPGGEEASMVGMIAWMRENGSELSRSGTLFLGLDTLGAGEPVVASREGWSASYRKHDLALADQGAARAGLQAPKRFGLGTSSDPIIAKHAGFAALSILSQKDGTLGNLHLPEDVPATVDWDCVARSTQLASGIISAWTNPEGVKRQITIWP
jgi:acetylornithine deacetylase/succinyl-diaminopimelate desuccinylase-like protein